MTMMANRDITSEISHCHQSMNILVDSDCLCGAISPKGHSVEMNFHLLQKLLS